MLNDTISVALLAAAYTPDQDNDSIWTDISADEVPAGGGYAAGGAALAGKTVTKNNLEDYAVFDANDVADWAAATFTGARYAVVYKSSGLAVTQYLIYCLDLLTVKNAPLELIWNTDGIFAVGRCA